MYKNVHRSTISNNPKLETTQMFSCGLDKVQSVHTMECHKMRIMEIFLHATGINFTHIY